MYVMHVLSSARVWCVQHRVREHPRQVQRRLPAGDAVVRALERGSLRRACPAHVPQLLVRSSSYLGRVAILLKSKNLCGSSVVFLCLSWLGFNSFKAHPLVLDGHVE